jgi:hypothetical protein
MIAAAFFLVGCGASDGGSAFDQSPTPAVPSATGAAPGLSNLAFAPPPPSPGYTRLVSKTVAAIQPGQDITHCQYIMAPVDHDVDILGVLGYQSKFGHHATAFVYTPKAGEQVGSDFPCMGSEYASDPSSLTQSGGFLGAVGANGKVSTSALPEGLALRLKKGSGVMLSVHYVNTGADFVDGNAVVDLEMAPADPTRTVAALFTNVNVDFDIPPAAEVTSTISCVAQSELQIVMAANHMHEDGKAASTQVIHPDGSIQDLRTDTSWTYDQQINPVFGRFPLDNPLVVRAGDTIRTSCTWQNSTANDLKFPREMCIGVAFAISERADGSVPSCAAGNWIEAGL